MKTITQKFPLGLLTLVPVMLLGANQALAQDENQDPAIYSCTQCMRYHGWRGEIDFGLGDVSEESLRFADYRGLDEEGARFYIDGDLHYRDRKGWYLDLYSVNTVYDNRSIELRNGKTGLFELRLGWQEVPKYRGYGTQTPYLGVGTDNLSLPADWVYAPFTEQMTALQGSLAAAALKTQRKTADAGATVRLGGGFSYKIDFQRQKKEGTRAVGAGLLNASIVPAPVDFVTDILDTSIEYTGKRLQLRAGFMRSVFENEYASLTWRNPFASRPQNDYLQTALEPGNEFSQYNISAALMVTERIRFSFRAANGQMKQNDPFLAAYSTNPDFDYLVLPRTSLDGKLDTQTRDLTGKLSARLGKGLSLTLRGDYDERDNKTPVDLYTPVTVDLFRGGERYNRPYSYEREKYSADLRYRVNRNVRLSAGAERKDMTRTLQEVEESEETTYWGEIKGNLTLASQVTIKFENGEREVGDYLQPDDGSPVDHPLMRKFNQADRDRDRVTVRFDLAPTDALGVNLSYFNAKADYTESEIGLQESEDENYTIDLSYALGDKGSLYAFYTRDNIDSTMRNATSATAEPWYAQTSDEITTIGFGISARVGDNTSIGIDYVNSDSTGEILVQTGADEPFSPLSTDLTNTKLYFNHEFGEHWAFKLYVEYEEFESSDWAIDGLGVDGIPSVLTMGEVSPQYDAWYTRILASYRF
jgi:MtrB/PioB family decaheme-associated outer membrane protein